MNGKSRSYLLGVVGGYLLYLAYELFQDRGNPDTTMAPGVMILFIALFVLTGAALLVYAVYEWKRSPKEEEPPPRDDQKDVK